MYYCTNKLACELTLRDALTAGGKRKENLQLHVSGIWIPNPIPLWLPSTEQSDFRQSARRTRSDVNKHWKTRAKGNDVITSVISANQHFASTFPMQILKFQRRSCKLSFLFPRRRQNALESLLACYKLICSSDFLMRVSLVLFFHFRIMQLKKWLVLKDVQLKSLVYQRCNAKPWILVLNTFALSLLK